MNNAVEAIFEKVHRVVAKVQRRRWLAVGVASGVAMLSGLVISFIPNQYEAKAHVYVDTQTVLKPLMSGLTYQPDIDQQVRMLARTLVSRPNMQRLLEVPELHLADPDPSRREELVSRLIAKIKVMPTGSDNYYEISYRGSDGEQARRLVDATVDLFVQSGVIAKQRDSQDAGHFIEDQIRSYEEKLAEAENRLKDFKVRNFGATGVSAQDYFARVSALSEDVNRLRVELNAAEMARDAFRRSLDAEGRGISIDGVPSPAIVEIETRLEAQRKQLDDFLQRFTERHPDVLNTRRVIEELSAELRRRKDAEAQGHVSAGADKKSATSPVYQKLRVSLAETEAQVASLRSQLGMKQSALDQARAVGDRMPQVEAELAQLNRDYDVIRKNYEALVSRREAALLGAKLNESSQLAEFRIIEPAKVSSSPVFPSRLHLALIAVLAAVAAGLGSTVVVDAIRPTVDGVAALHKLSGRPVLGVVSFQVPPAVSLQQRTNTLRFAGVVAALVLMQAVWVAWIASTQ